MSVQRWASITGLAAFLLSFAIGSTAYAISVDFSTASWSGADGQASFTTHPSGIDLFANVGTLTVTPDGLGIVDDEIGSLGIERLTVTFAAPVTLQTVLITNLFPCEGFLGCTAEIGAYSLNGGSFNSFSSASGTGDLTLNVNVAGVNSIVFRSNFDLISDYSVRGLTFATPEPSSLLLLGGVMLGLGFSRRKLKELY
jgi:hypothetical protein